MMGKTMKRRVPLVALMVLLWMVLALVLGSLLALVTIPLVLLIEQWRTGNPGPLLLAVTHRNAR